VAGDYRWFASNTDLSKGFSFVWVKGLETTEVLERLGGEELERVYWKQLVGSGDGHRGDAGRMFFGIARMSETWVLVVEDNGTLGTTESLLRPLSRGTTVISHYRGANARSRLLLITDQAVDLDLDPLAGSPRAGGKAAELASTLTAVGFGESRDPAQGTAAAFALTERLTGVAMTEDLLNAKTYVLGWARRT
jgi:hypothetical protein